MNTRLGCEGLSTASHLICSESPHSFQRHEQPVSYLLMAAAQKPPEQQVSTEFKNIPRSAKKVKEGGGGVPLVVILTNHILSLPSNETSADNGHSPQQVTGPNKKPMQQSVGKRLTLESYTQQVVEIHTRTHVKKQVEKKRGVRWCGTAKTSSGAALGENPSKAKECQRCEKRTFCR